MNLNLNYNYVLVEMGVDLVALANELKSSNVATLALGSRPRQGLEGLQAKRKHGSEGKCEGMNPRTPKGVSILEV